MNDPHRFEYSDLALTAVTDDELETLEIFHTRSAEIAVQRAQRELQRHAREAATTIASGSRP